MPLAGLWVTSHGNEEVWIATIVEHSGYEFIYEGIGELELVSWKVIWCMSIFYEIEIVMMSRRWTVIHRNWVIMIKIRGDLYDDIELGMGLIN